MIIKLLLLAGLVLFSVLMAAMAIILRKAERNDDQQIHRPDTAPNSLARARDPYGYFKPRTPSNRPHHSSHQSH